MGVAGAEKCKAAFSMLQTHRIALSFSSAATTGESVSLAHSLLDTFSQKVTPSVILHATLVCLLPTLLTYSPLYYAA